MKQTLLRLIAASAVLLQLVGCGGGGAGGSSPATTGTPTMALTMIDVATQAPTRLVSIGSSVEVSALVLDGAKKPVSGALVAFEIAEPALATLKPSSGTRMTGDDGVAKIRIDAASLGSAGATTVSASAEVTSGTTTSTTTATTTTATAKFVFDVGAANVTLSGMSTNLPEGISSLSPYATTSITVKVGGVPTSTAIPIEFSSNCTNSTKASITPSVNSANGVATATYADLGCGATDTIYATVAGTAITTSIPLAVSPPSAAAIQFVSATPSTIVIKGTGGTNLFESSQVTFKLLDNNNQPIANQPVELSLTTRSGGIVLDGTTIGSISRQTKADGTVTVPVSSGTTPTSVWVVASHTTPGGLTFATQSAALVISTGRPTQDRFSVSIETWNIEGWNVNFATTKASVIASDRVGNPVPDGTPINFSSSGGQIGTTSVGVCTTVNGACNVVFTSGGLQPANGRVAITAYALGEESFQDKNSNNIYDSGEAFTDLGEAFVDNNFDNTWQLGEQAFNFGSNSSTCVSTMAISPSAPSKSGTCDGIWGAAHVRQSNIVVLSGAQLNITSGLITSNTGSNCQPVSVTFRAWDENNNPLPSGTTLSVENMPDKGWSAVIKSSKVPNTAAIGGSSHTVTFTPTVATAECGAVVGFTARISATTPNGRSSTAASTITVKGATLSVPSAAPTGVTAAATTVSKQLSVAFFAPASNTGSPITGYTASCTDSAVAPGPYTKTASNTASPILVDGLASTAPGATCTVVATNSVGAGPASAASAVVAPKP